MAYPSVATTDEPGPTPGPTQASRDNDNIRVDASAVSWGAILAGAAAAAALSLILLILGTGLGLSSVSPWAYSGIGAVTFGVSTILWVSLSQLLASGMGGYLAGRLRTKWLAVHGDEVYFRDTAHGFLAWAIASLVTATLLTSMIGSIVTAGIQSVPEIAKSDAGPMSYFVDSLFRKDPNAASTASVRTANGVMLMASAEKTSTAPLTEVSRIFINSIHTGALPSEDIRYVGQLVAQRTALSQQAAEARVNSTYLRLQSELRKTEKLTKELAEKARKASAYAALWLFISLLSGAFVASYAATYGGQRRDA